MIAVDTSALVAIVLNEPQADGCVAALDGCRLLYVGDDFAQTDVERAL